MNQVLTVKQRNKINAEREANIKRKQPQGVQYEKDANKKVYKQKLSKTQNNRKKYDVLK